MKRQNHGLTLNTDSQWPIEELEEKMGILNEARDHRNIGKHIPSVARPKEGLASEHYHGAVALLAYELWEKGGRLQGASDENWFKAEAALKPLWAADQSFASGDFGTDNTGKL
jgi:hypothetical protein